MRVQNSHRFERTNWNEHGAKGSRCPGARLQTDREGSCAELLDEEQPNRRKSRGLHRRSGSLALAAPYSYTDLLVAVLSICNLGGPYLFQPLSGSRSITEERVS